MHSKCYIGFFTDLCDHSQLVMPIPIHSMISDEDLYRDEEEIKKEKIQKGIATIEKGTAGTQHSVLFIPSHTLLFEFSFYSVLRLCVLIPFPICGIQVRHNVGTGVWSPLHTPWVLALGDCCQRPGSSITLIPHA